MNDRSDDISHYEGTLYQSYSNTSRGDSQLAYVSSTLVKLILIILAQIMGVRREGHLISPPPPPPTPDNKNFEKKAMENTKWT